MRRVRDVMCGEIDALASRDSVVVAARYLVAHDVDAVPVCADDGSLAGTVGIRDIVALVVARGLDPGRVTLGEITVLDGALGVDADLPVEEAASIMWRHDATALPVLEGSRVVGHVTQRDVARTMAVGPWVDG